MKSNFGIEEFKLLKDLERFEELIYSNGESFLINGLSGEIILAESITDLLDYYNVEDRVETIKEINECYKKIDK